MKKFSLRLLFALGILILARHSHSDAHLAYIGPGAGFAFLGSFLTIVLSLFASLVSLLLWPFRVVWLSVRHRGRLAQARVKTVIVLGLDGLDPNLTERWINEGKLPNLARLREQGSYTRLRTTFPALSPVAWSTFATGVNPAKHNIFDFLNRDLRTYVPELASARVRASEHVWRIGRWRLPFSRASVELRRKSEPFWKILGRYAIPSTILRVPVTFPPDHFHGRLLSAMSTPDLRGTQGSFTWYSTDARHTSLEGGLRLPLTQRTDFYEGILPGPEKTQIAFTLARDYTLTIQNQQIVLKQGQYTPWIRLRFGFARGIVRFLLTQIAPHIELYVTPIELDPERPALPISHPAYYAAYLAKLLGTYATLGMAEDTWALNEGAIDENAFLAQAKLIQHEREQMFFSALERTRRGVIACVFDTTDRVQHMFFRHLDSGSPHAHVIENLYRDMDRIVGRMLEYADTNTAVFVLSDHGFCSFRSGVNLNAWLHQNGYLALESDTEESGEYLSGIDWSRTRAYAFGLGGLYLNLQGREARGIVPPAEAAALKSELIEKLIHLRDPETGEAAIRAVYDAHVIYRGPYLDAAPDLVPGYAPGYRASWSAAAGRVTRAVFEPNDKPWSGDHCVDPAAVPGVLFSNCKLDAANPGIEDLAPTILHLFGIAPPGWMEGQTLCAL